jgi:hypothetical protein
MQLTRSFLDVAVSIDKVFVTDSVLLKMLILLSLVNITFA